MSTSAAETIILYHYVYSPYGRKVFWYLRLRGIPFSQCLQPPILPRPDLTSLGVNYRRIPLLAIGRDIYCDTHLIIAELERRFPPGTLGSSDLLTSPTSARTWGQSKAWTTLLEDWANEVFVHAVRLLPQDLPLLKDPRFQEDRKGMFGGGGSGGGKPQSADLVRAESLAATRSYFTFIETQLLTTPEQQFLSGSTVSLNDIVVMFPIDWLLTLPGALPTDLFNNNIYPNIYGWHGRFKALLKTLPNPTTSIATLSGPSARSSILLSPPSSPFKAKTTFDTTDPLNLTPGELVQVTPTDSGRTHPQRGRVVELSVDRVTVEVDVPGAEGGEVVRVHFPRRKYTIRKVKESKV